MMWLLSVVTCAYALHHRSSTPVHVDMVNGGDASCYQESDKGKSYKGLKNTIPTGEKCHGYCRNDDESEAEPWCYLVSDIDPNTGAVEDTAVKKICGVEMCTSEGPFARKFDEEAGELKTKMSAADCDCADELYGSTTTTANTKYGFLQGSKKKPCKCP